MPELWISDHPDRSGGVRAVSIGPARRVSRRRRSIHFSCLLSLLVAASLLLPVSFLALTSRTDVSWSSRVEASTSPDLVPAALTAPTPGFRQGWISATWTVENQGTGTAVGGWTDSLYISPTSICCAGATLLGAVSWPSGLAVAAGAIYTQGIFVPVPNLPIGNYYLILRVNARGTLSEANAGNNEFAVRFRIAPLLDLVTIALTAPASASAQQAISVSWTVANGAPYMPEPATASPWQDNLYISPNSTCCAGATFLGSWLHTGGLVFNARYTQTQTVTVPNLHAGAYYLIVSADATNVQPEANEDNQDWARINVTTPDLVPTALAGPAGPASASTQQAISVSWSVQNQGTGATVLPWQDHLYISPNPTCCEGATFLGGWSRTGSLVPRAGYTQAKTVTVPNLAAGDYYLIVWTNATGTLHEENDANNQRAIPIKVTTPDLLLTALTAPGSVGAGQIVPVSWTVRNQGTGLTVGTWTDKLYLSPTSSCCTGATLLGQWDRSLLAAGASYTQTKSITVPNPAAGSYYLIVQTDISDVLYESNEGNNQRAIPIAVTTADLAPTALSAPPSVSTQQAIAVSWTVKNQGTGPSVGTWTDKLYLSPTSTCCAGATALGQWAWLATVAGGASYTQTKSITVPNLAAGSYYLILETDAANTLYESNDGNNQRVIPITVTTPDLVPTALSAPASAAAGRVISLSWTVKNQGTGPTVGTWTDKMYISANPTCCVGTTSLGSWSATALAGQASYTQTKSVTIPALAAGTYYLTVWTDANGQLYETREDNNRRALPITVTSTSVPPASVLAITSVNGGGEPTAGAGFSVVVEARDVGGISRNVTSATAVRLGLRSGAGVLGGTLTGTIPAGASQATISGVTYTKAESGVVLTASRTSGAALSPGDGAPFTVRPGPVASYALSLSSPQQAGTTFGVAVTARDQLANTVTTDSSTVVTLRSSSGHVLFDGNADGVFGDATKALSAGTLSLNAKGTTAETITVIATDANGKTGSAPLTVTSGAASTLAFTTQPGSARAGSAIPGPPTVVVKDGFGNTVTSSTAPITIAIGTNPGGGALAGTTTKAAIGGVASFGDLTISRPGTGYTLTAAAPGLTAAGSAVFTITAAIGTISGRVTRASDGSALSAAVVDALQAGLVKGSTRSGADGTYSMAGLAPGSYDVRASAAGYQAKTQAGVSITAGSTAAVNFTLNVVPAPAVRITSPAAGSVIDRLTVLVRGEVSGATGSDVGVTVNGMPGFVDGGQFVALVPVDPTVTAFTATASSFTVALSTDSIPVTVQPSAADPPVSLRATPSAGLAPLTVGFDLSGRVGIAQIALDVDGNGTTDFQGSSLAGVTFTLSQPGIYPSQVRVTDLRGQVQTATTVVQVFDRVALNQRLQAVWQGVRDALRVGDVAGAVAFVHSDTRERYREQFDQLSRATLGSVDQIMTTIELVEVGFAGAEYEMLRAQDGQFFSYAVWFQLDQDGLWRVRSF